MEYAIDLSDLMKKLQRFIMQDAAALPERVRDQLVEVSGSPSPLDRIIQTLEVLHAAGESNTPASRTLSAQLGRYIADSVDPVRAERAGAIHGTAMREAGEPGKWPVASKDPEPLETYAEKPVSKAPAPPAPAPVA